MALVTHPTRFSTRLLCGMAGITLVETQARHTTYLFFWFVQVYPPLLLFIPDYLGKRSRYKRRMKSRLGRTPYLVDLWGAQAKASASPGGVPSTYGFVCVIRKVNFFLALPPQPVKPGPAALRTDVAIRLFWSHVCKLHSPFHSRGSPSSGSDRIQIPTQLHCRHLLLGLPKTRNRHTRENGSGKW